MHKQILKFIHFNDSYQIDRTPQFLDMLNKHRENSIVLFSGDIFFPSIES